MADDVDSWLRNAPFKLKRQLAQAVQAEAERVREAIAEAAPKASGELAASVRVRRKRNTLQFEVLAGGDATTREVRKGSGASYDYALGTEFGNAHEPAHPFFYATWREMRDGVRQNLEDAVNDVVREL